METPHQIAIIALVLIRVSPAPAAEPSPTPTPPPRTLAEVAASRMLVRSPGADTASPILITDDNLDQLSRGAVVTLMPSTAAEPMDFPVEVRPDSKTREKWRKKVFAQKKALSRLEAKRASVDTEIDRLGHGQLDSRTLDRLAKADVKRQAIDDEIRTERMELSRIIREARKAGAQPGWFR